jgi:hypothetical protein
MFVSRNRHTAYVDRDLRVWSERLVDRTFHHYLDWRRQASTCDFAYRHGATPTISRESATAFATYSAALDREDQAALYELAVRGCRRSPKRRSHS